MPYSLDTSGILDAWVCHYPPDVFPTIWTRMEEAVGKARIFAIEEVVRELEKKEDGVYKWVRSHPAMIVPIDADIQNHLAHIMSKYQRLVDSKKNRSGGDPWVIALAKSKGLTVVTAEKPSGNLIKPKIPDVCRDMEIPCIEILEFFVNKIGNCRRLQLPF